MAATAKGFLEDARRLQERLRRTSARLEQIDAMLGLHGLDASGERVGGSGGRDMLAERLDELHRCRDELAGLVADYVELQRFADRVIDMLPDARHRQVLAMRYLEGRGYREIARAMSFSESRVMQLHRAALAALDEVLGHNGGDVSP